MLQFSREKLFLHAEICATFWYQLRHFPWPEPTPRFSLHPLIRNETPVSPDLVHYQGIIFPNSLATLYTLCSLYGDPKILILFLAMMNLIGDIWVAQLVNDQLTKKTNNGWWFYIYQRKLGTWAEVIIMTVNDKTFSSELIVFRRKQKDWVHATIRIVDTKTICHVSLIRW